MKYVQYPVPKELKNIVRYFWSYDSNANPESVLHIKSFADKYPRLIFQNISEFEPIKNSSEELAPICYLSGLDTHPTDAYWYGAFSHFGVSFYPHALATLFKIDAFELTNQIPSIELLDKTDLPSKLQKAKDHFERVAIVSEYLYYKLQSSRQDLLIEAILHNTVIDNEYPIQHITKQYKISERQFQRRFKSSIGITPIKFLRINKFERALELMSQSKFGQLTQLAYELGYADQSHFIKDFIDFSGSSPYDFIKNKNLGTESSSFIYTDESSL